MQVTFMVGNILSQLDKVSKQISYHLYVVSIVYEVNNHGKLTLVVTRAGQVNVLLSQTIHLSRINCFFFFL